MQSFTAPQLCDQVNPDIRSYTCVIPTCCCGFTKSDVYSKVLTSKGGPYSVTAAPDLW